MKHSSTIGAVVCALLALGARAAHAYTGDNCKVTTQNYESLTSTGGGSISVSSNAGQFVVVACPITKTTSGPGLFNEQISQVTLTQNSLHAGDVSCNFRIYSSYYDTSMGSNVYADVPASSTAAGQQTLNLGQASWDVWWGGSTSWLFADIVCTMWPGSSISSYSVTENGSTQPNYKIYSAASCKRADGSAYLFGEGSVIGGYWQAASSGPYTLNCPIPSGDQRGVQISAGPSISSLSTFECSYDGSHWTLVPPNPGPAPYPTKTLEFAVASGAQTIRCRRSGSNQGDPQFFSYRTFPLTALSHSGWAASANPNNNTAGNAINNSNTTDRWTTGTGQNNNPVENQFFQVNLGSAKKFHQIVLDSTASANDFPRGYKVYVSNDGSSWGSAIVTGAGTSDIVKIQVPPTTAKYIKITQTSTTPSRWWSITKFDVYVASPP